MNINSKRNLILTAAATVIRELGADKLTIDAVAKEAGVSKGGVLHHFPNKQSLIDTLFDESMMGFLADLRQKASDDIEDAGKWSRAYISTTVHYNRNNRSIDEAIIASLSLNPELLTKYQEEFAILQAYLENDGIDPVKSTIIRLAMDGLWFSEILRIGNMDDSLRSQVFECLTNMSLK